MKGPPPSKFAALYYDPDNPVAYTGSDRLLAKAAKSTTKRAREWLATQDSYTLHKYARKRFPHPRIYVEGLDEQWGADLIDLQHLAPSNDGMQYLLTVVDTLSKYAWVRPLRNKTATSTAEALESIFDEGRSPRRLRTDRGKEFLGRPVQNLLAKKNIVYFTANNYTKEAIVERFNRTLRGKMWRYFRATNTDRYVDVLQKLVRGYNATKHRSTGMAPTDVDVLNQHLAWTKLYGHKRGRGKERPSFQVGDIVRIAKDKKLFEQGYKSNWSEELFTINAVLRLPYKSGYKYKIVDSTGEEILGSFQKEELQKVRVVPKEIRSIVKRGPDAKYVTWRGYPQTLRTRIPL
ncbi:MAG: DDE-type integrase/transposase/recombinase [Gemmatimonadota bacterium]|nr:DDE-type integrase/transposase/recombinase [Gemmatimonadota bacterium]